MVPDQLNTNTANDFTQAEQPQITKGSVIVGAQPQGAPPVASQNYNVQQQNVATNTGNQPNNYDNTSNLVYNNNVSQGQYAQQTQGILNDDTAQKFMPTKNKYSLIAYYLGFVGIIPFIGFPFGIAAIFFGIKAMKLYKQNPTPGAKGHAIVGLVLGVISVICGILFSLLFVAIAISEPSTN